MCHIPHPDRRLRPMSPLLDLATLSTALYLTTLGKKYICALNLATDYVNRSMVDLLLTSLTSYRLLSRRPPVDEAGDIAEQFRMSVRVKLYCLHANSINTGAISSKFLWAHSGLLASTSLHLASVAAAAEIRALVLFTNELFVTQIVHVRYY